MLLAQWRHEKCELGEGARPFPSLSLPFFPFFSFTLLFLSFFSTFHSFPLEVGPLKLAKGSGERCELPQLGLGRSLSPNQI